MDRLSPADQQRVHASASIRHLQRRDRLFDQGVPLRELFIVLRGRIRVYYISEQGNQLTFAYWSEGTLVGTPGVRDTFEHMWNAEASMESELLAIPGDQFSALLKDIPGLALGVIEALEFKARRLASLAQILATSSVPVRLQMLLINLAELYGVAQDGGWLISVPFTHEEIAGMVGASRPWVSTMMARMHVDGLLGDAGRLIFIPDLERFKRVDFKAFRPTNL